MFYYFIIGLIAAVWGGYLAANRGRSSVMWGIICGLFPLAIIFLALSSEKMGVESSNIIAGYGIAGDSKAISSTSTPVTRAAIEPRVTLNNSSSDFDKARWEKLIEYDQDIQAYASRVGSLGKEYLDKFAKDYMTLNDKSYLGSIFEKIERQAALDNERRRIEGDRYRVDGNFWGISFRSVENGAIVGFFPEGSKHFESKDQFENFVKKDWRAKNVG